MCGAPSPCAASSATVRQLERAGAAVVEEGAVHEDAVHDAEVARTRDAEIEADGTRPLDDVGLFDHAPGRGIRLVVDAGDPGQVVHVRLRVAVRLGRPVPLEVVVGEVQAHARVRRDRLRTRLESQVPELVARELDHEHVEAGRIADGVEHRRPDVADGRGAQPALDEHRRRQARGGGLAVRARHEHPVRRRAVGAHDLVAHAPGELDVAPERGIRFLRPLDERMPRREARRGDDHVGREVDELLRHGVEGSGPQARPDDGKQPLVLLVRLLGDDEHVGAELGEGVGGREAGDREPEHRDAQALPVRVPAREGVQAGF